MLKITLKYITEQLRPDCLCFALNRRLLDGGKKWPAFGLPGAGQASVNFFSAEALYHDQLTLSLLQ